MIFITKKQLIEHAVQRHLYMTKRIVRVANKFNCKLNARKRYFNRVVVPKICEGVNCTNDIANIIKFLIKMRNICKIFSEQNTICKYVHKEFIQVYDIYRKSFYGCYCIAADLMHYVKYDSDIVLSHLNSIMQYIHEYKRQLARKDEGTYGGLIIHIREMNDMISVLSKWISTQSAAVKYEINAMDIHSLKARIWLRLDEIFARKREMKKISQNNSDLNYLDYLDKNIIFREIINFTYETDYDYRFF